MAMASKRTTRRVARAGVAGAFVATVAVGVLQLLQQSIGAFNPRPVMYVLIGATVFFAGLAAERVRVRRSENASAQQLKRLLVVWPPRPLRRDDGLWLGVFPPRRDLDGDAPYVARRIDEDLRDALEPGAVVLVRGPSRSGKSRTAFEAVLEAADEASVVAPRGPDALAELLAFDPPLEVGGPRMVWLDGVERYAEMLDPSTLDELQLLGAPSLEPATVVATARDEEWETLLAASGARGATARALAARARVFEVPAQLDAAELAEASRRYPGTTFDGAIGATLASPGNEAGVPRTPTRPSEDRSRRTVALHDRFFAVPAGVATGTLTAFALVWILAGFSTPKPPSIPDQIESIIRKGSGAGRQARVPAPGPLKLQKSDAQSYFFYFRDRPGAATTPHSDRIEIWDRRGDYLVRRMSFEPDGPRAVFEFAAVADVDGDGDAEVVGGYALADEARQALVPFAIDWDDDARRYDVVALDRPPPTLSKTALERRYRVPERQYRAVYSKRVTFADRRSRLSISGHRVQEFIVTRPPRLVAAYFLQPPLEAVHNRAVLELHASILSATSGSPHLRPCELADAPPAQVELQWQSRSLTGAIAERWATASRDRFCVP
jgi:hypothetical protein